MSSNHSGSSSGAVTNKQRPQFRSPVSSNPRPGSASGAYKTKPDRRGSPIMQKITAFFKRERNTENGHVPVRPSCFADSPERKRSESPEPSSSGGRRGRSSSLNNNKLWKVGKTGGAKGSGVGWRPKGRLEWESDSGRQITIGDMSVNELSKVEIQAIQRIAINTLQGMDIPVSHGLLKGGRNVFQRLSFNTFKQRKVTGPERMVEGPPGSIMNSGVFGQPLNQVISQDQPTTVKSGSGTPVPSTPTSAYQYATLPFPSSTSPTSITSSETSFEMNPTTMLLEALSISPSNPSPKSKRRMSICPAEPQVPTIVTKAINYLDTKGVKTEGLFRISGAKSRINEIREKFDAGEDVELTDDMNPHDVACLLKEFFRSLPEPLMTVELFGPFLSTRKLSNSAQRRDALRLLCLLLPQPNRDTLQELLQFMSRVALHSDGIILIDGTEEVGNRMTERNLAMIMGPNILHKEVKRKSLKPTEMQYQVQKQDPEELGNVCKVMEDLIRMHLSIFSIPAQLYEGCLKSILATDSAAVDLILKRRCYEQGLFLDPDESPTRGGVSHSRSTDALRKISQTSAESALTLEQELLEQEYMWQRTHSLSNTQKKLDDAIRDLEEYIAEDLASINLQRRYSSNDSAMGGSEAVVSPLQLDTAYSEPSTLNRKRQVHDSVDSAFSNYSSPTNSSEGMHHTDMLSVESDTIIPCNHIRMSSEASNTSAVSPSPVLEPSPLPPGQVSPSPSPLPSGGQVSPSPVPEQVSPEMLMSPPLSKMEASSMPSLDQSSRGVREEVPRFHKSTSPLPSQPLPTPSSSGHSKKNKHRVLTTKVSQVGTYSHERSPILSSRGSRSAAVLHNSQSTDHTPTESTTNISNSPSGVSLDSSHFQGTVI